MRGSLSLYISLRKTLPICSRSQSSEYPNSIAETQTAEPKGVRVKPFTFKKVNEAHSCEPHSAGRICRAVRYPRSRFRYCFGVQPVSAENCRRKYLLSV